MFNFIKEEKNVKRYFVIFENTETKEINLVEACPDFDKVDEKDFLTLEMPKSQSNIKIISMEGR